MCHFRPEVYVKFGRQRIVIAARLYLRLNVELFFL